MGDVSAIAIVSPKKIKPTWEKLAKLARYFTYIKTHEPHTDMPTEFPSQLTYLYNQWKSSINQKKYV